MLDELVRLLAGRLPGVGEGKGLQGVGAADVPLGTEFTYQGGETFTFPSGRTATLAPS